MEPLEDVEYSRYTILPIKLQAEWEMYIIATELFWVPEKLDVELQKDRQHIGTMEHNIVRLIEHVIAFFAISDGVVNETIDDNIVDRIHHREIKFWYNYQMMMENIHNHMYSKLIETYIVDKVRRAKVFNAIENYPGIRKKVEWIKKWTATNEINNLSAASKAAIAKLRDVWYLVSQAGIIIDPHSYEMDGEVVELLQKLETPRPSLARQLLINVITEGVYFSSSFCVIFWVYNTYNKLPGLAKANEYISRDEQTHTMFGVFLYKNRIINKLPEAEVFEIISEAVDVEMEFIQEALPTGLLGMNATLMHQYVKFVADQLLVLLGYNILYRATNPFTFMEKQSISVRMSDFFIDTDVTEYGGLSGLRDEDQMLNFEDY
jgi:ribonucleoside-diphosphate reductase beta chain